MPRFDKLLVLDMDETLIHASEEALDHPPDFRVFDYEVYRRPGVEAFLETCLDWFRVGIWTSASRDLALSVLNRLIAAPNHLEFLWARERCTLRREEDRFFWLKNIAKLKRQGYALSRIIAVDDSPEKWQLSYGNLVRVRPFLGREDDDELFRLLPYLEWLGAQDNIRRIEKRGWRNHGSTVNHQQPTPAK